MKFYALRLKDSTNAFEGRVWKHPRATGDGLRDYPHLYASEAKARQRKGPNTEVVELEMLTPAVVLP